MSKQPKPDQSTKKLKAKKPKKKRSKAEKLKRRLDKQERDRLFEYVMINGKQKKIRRAQPLIDGIPQDEFLAQNASPEWLIQNDMYELVPEDYYDSSPDIDEEDVDDEPNPERDAFFGRK